MVGEEKEESHKEKLVISDGSVIGERVIATIAEMTLGYLS
jgi:hypothetical protein